MYSKVSRLSLASRAIEPLRNPQDAPSLQQLVVRLLNVRGHRKHIRRAPAAHPAQGQVLSAIPLTFAPPHSIRVARLSCPSQASGLQTLQLPPDTASSNPVCVSSASLHKENYRFQQKKLRMVIMRSNSFDKRFQEPCRPPTIPWEKLPTRKISKKSDSFLPRLRRSSEKSANQLRASAVPEEVLLEERREHVGLSSPCPHQLSFTAFGWLAERLGLRISGHDPIP
nr:hypothetical protein Iba_chr14aCG22040 [Ipomoea batatas]